MDKAQKELLKSYYHARGIAVSDGHHKYEPYEWSKFALDNKIMDLETLPIGEKFKVFQDNPRVREYITPYIDAYNKNAKGILRVILEFKKSKDGTALWDFITKSKFIQDNGDPEKVEIDYNVDLGVNKGTLLNYLNLEYDYDGVYSTYHGGDDYVDSDEENYMQHWLDGANKQKINNIAAKLGYAKDRIAALWDKEGQLAKFFEAYKMDDIRETMFQEYGEAKAEAQSEVAGEQLELFPFEFDSGYYRQDAEAKLDIDKALRFLYAHDLSDLKTFDDFLSAVEDKTELSYDNIHERAYEREDLSELNRVVGNELDNLEMDLDDPSHEFYKNVEAVKELQDSMKKYGFKPSENTSAIATRRQKDKTIHILDYGYDPDEDRIQFKVAMNYPHEDGEDKGIAKTSRQGWIYADKLGDYIDQYEIPQLKEDIMNLIEQLNNIGNGK